MSSLKKDKVVIVTGGIGSGKTTVCNIFKEFGAKIVSADDLARIAIAESKDTIKSFFPTAYDSHGTLDRKKLGEIVFNDKTKRDVLENILHPIIKNLSDIEFSKFKSENLIIYECPLFFESNLDKNDYKAVIVVTCPEEQIIKRVALRDNLGVGSIKSRISAQLEERQKIEKADYLINNSECLSNLRVKVKELYEKLI